MKNLISPEEKQESASAINSQNIPLLESAHTDQDANSKGSIDITIVQQSALLADTGPLGTSADIKDGEALNDRINLYVVREGDNLSQIAKMFNVSVNTIIWSNDIGRNGVIVPGQILVILPVSGIQYSIKQGDSIKDLAKKFNGDIGEIIEFNGLDEKGTLIAGQTILIPNGEYTTTQSKNYYAPKTAQASGAPSYSGYYMRPVMGGVKSQGLHGYNAVDLANSCGTPIMASATGDAIIAKSYGWNAGAGNYIVISHPNGTQTLYAHLERIAIGAGWHVVQGQVIGYVGSSGNSTGCHLHFEIRGARNPF